MSFTKPESVHCPCAAACSRQSHSSPTSAVHLFLSILTRFFFVQKACREEQKTRTEPFTGLPGECPEGGHIAESHTPVMRRRKHHVWCPQLLFPESFTLNDFGRSSGLPHLRCLPVSRRKQWLNADIEDAYGAYSSGVCPGLSPGSLFTRSRRIAGLGHQNLPQR